MPALRLSPATPRDNALAPIRNFESATAEVIGGPPRLPQRLTLYVMVLMIVVIVVFISVTKIDRIVRAPGRLIPVAGTLTVQPLEKSIISRVLVQVGDVVKKGQVLAFCDPTFAKADLVTGQQKIDSLKAQLRRMEAEDAGKPLPPSANNGYDVLQASIWEQRRVEFDAGVHDFDQRINAAQAQLSGLRQSVPDLQARLEIARKVESMNGDLVKSGYVSQLEFLTAKDQRVQAETNLTTAQSTLDATMHTLESLKQQREAFIKKWHEGNLDNLATAKDSLDAAVQDLEKLKKVSELTELVSPEDAIVVKIPNLSSGGVAVDAQPLFSLVKIDAPLEVSVLINSADIGFVKVGDQVRIKFDAYKFLEHGEAYGVIKTISADSFTEYPTQDAVTGSGASGGSAGGSDPKEPVFEAHVQIQSVKLHDVPKNFRLGPGMTVQTDIVVGERTIIWYLLGGAMRSGSEAMQEP